MSSTTGLSEETIEEIARHYAAIISLLGEDITREGLVRTPMRAAKAMAFATRGYRQDPDVIINDAIFTHEGSNMVIVRDIEFYSLCEHHILPFFGKVSIGYIPDGRTIGLSKLARLVDFYARRLQVQERGECSGGLDCGGCGELFLDTAHLHAEMVGSACHNDTFGSELLHHYVAYLRCETFLHL